MTEPSDDRTTDSARRWHPAPLVIGVLVLLALVLVALVSARQGEDDTSVPTTSTLASWQSEFLDCVAQRESGDDPTAVGPGSQAFGTYQITQETWDNTARHYGWYDLVGIRPDQASAAQQQQVATGLLEWQGTEPWGGGCST